MIVESAKRTVFSSLNHLYSNVFHWKTIYLKHFFAFKIFFYCKIPALMPKTISMNTNCLSIYKLKSYFLSNPCIDLYYWSDNIRSVHTASMRRWSILNTKFLYNKFDCRLLLRLSFVIHLNPVGKRFWNESSSVLNTSIYIILLCSLLLCFFSPFFWILPNTLETSWWPYVMRAIQISSH